MRNGHGRKLTDLEALVMDRLWELGEGAVRDVRDSLSDEKPMAYNTVLTVMRILRDKGFVESERRGRADIYRPLVTRQQMGRRSLRETLELFFRGSPASLVSHLMEGESLSPREIQEIRREVNRRLRQAESKKDGKK